VKAPRGIAPGGPATEDRLGKTATEPLEHLELHYDFQPSQEWDLLPNQIVVTTDPQFQVPNTLRFNIRNPLERPVINFDNPDELTPADDLPPVNHQQAWPKPVDRLYLWFPWCKTLPVQCNGKLTTTLMSEGIKCYADPAVSANWYTKAMDDSDIGRYWILFPKDQAVHLDAGESIQFIIEHIVTEISAGTTTEIYIKPNVEGYDSFPEAVAAVHLTDPAPLIRMHASTGYVLAGGEVKLTWKTLNARSCTLSPIDGVAKPVPTQEPDGYPVYPFKTTTYTLTAKNPLGTQTSSQVTVNVVPVSIVSFHAVPSTGVRVGHEVALKWETVSADTCEILPEVGVVCEKAKGCSQGERMVHPFAYTEYTLTASGEGSRKATLVVFPLRLGWSETTGNAPWKTGGRPVALLFTAPGQVPAIWLLAAGTGELATYVYWSRDGQNWSSSNKPALQQRGSAGGAVFLEKMWLMGGVGTSGKLNDVWSSANGLDWLEAKPAGLIWSPRSGFGCIAFLGKLWVLGGASASGELLNDIWSSADGYQWTNEGTAQWTPRSDFAAAIYQEKIWILGGKLAGNVTNQVWSSADGRKWSQESDGKWSARSGPCAQAIRDRLYLSCGAAQSGDGIGGLWYLSGGQWVSTQGPPLKDRRDLGSVQYQEALWLLGGQIYQSGNPGPANQQVWVFAP
jgi:hypothetical protein